MKLPVSLEGNANQAVEILRRYYSARLNPALEKGEPWFSGAFFDQWDGAKDEQSPDRFTAEDIVAASFLSVQIPQVAAVEILYRQAEYFSALLAAIGPDRDLAEVPEGEIGPEWRAWKLTTELRKFRDVGPVRATKLVARKRPRLYPIYDSKVSALIGTPGKVLEPLHAELRKNSELREKLWNVREHAGLPDTISEIRVFDVIAWMEQTGN